RFPLWSIAAMSVRWLTFLVLSIALLGCAQAENAAPIAAEDTAASDGGASGATEVMPVAAPSEPNPDSPHNKLTEDEIAAGWILLFDGHSLFGWQPHSKANWAVKDEAISVSEGEPGLLCTTVQFSDYELSIDFQAEEKTNSGI